MDRKLGLGWGMMENEKEENGKSLQPEHAHQSFSAWLWVFILMSLERYFAEFESGNRREYFYVLGGSLWHCVKARLEQG